MWKRKQHQITTEIPRNEQDTVPVQLPHRFPVVSEDYDHDYRFSATKKGLVRRIPGQMGDSPWADNSVIRQTRCLWQRLRMSHYVFFYSGMVSVHYWLLSYVPPLHTYPLHRSCIGIHHHVGKLGRYILTHASWRVLPETSCHKNAQMSSPPEFFM